jgi:hypothetical protein
LTETDNKNNTIEIVRTAKVISGDKELAPHITEDVKIDYDDFKIYAEAWDDVRFTFKLVIKPESEKPDSTDTSHMKYGFKIANNHHGGSLAYPGMKISAVNINKDGTFVNGELELVTFNSIGKDRTVYENRVIVRLTKKESQ